MNSQLLSLFTAIFAGISVGCIAKYILHKITEFEVEKDRKLWYNHIKKYGDTNNILR